MLMVGSKLKQFNYRYDDTDTVMNELSEFYPYLEMPGVVENAQKFRSHLDARECPREMVTVHKGRD